MRKLIAIPTTMQSEVRSMAQTILRYIKGESWGERMRQFFCWGANKFYSVYSEDGAYGLEFSVSGLKHKGRVRVYYNVGSDYFDVELLKPRKNEVVYECTDLDFMQLHNVLHQHIEREDDPEV